MIEATAAPATDEPTAATPASFRAARGLRRPLTLAVGWLLFAAGLGWFVFAGSVRVGAGHWLGQRLRVRLIWTRFLDFLADHGASSLLVGLVGLAAVLTLLGSLALLWWVLGQQADADEPPAAPDAS
ncbi:MAG: hypothetical protein R2853_20045 [Thermomicrobiales bacterium]|nr:hypothetical protein [Thermomicrobiales bacterium]